MNFWSANGFALVQSSQKPNVSVVLFCRPEIRAKFQDTERNQYYFRRLSDDITEQEYRKARKEALEFLKGRTLFCNENVEPHHWYDAGLDLHLKHNYVFTANEPREIFYKEQVLVPHGCVGLLMARSSTNRLGNLRAGVVDPTYTGELRSTFVADEGMVMKQGTAFAQLVLLKCETPFLKAIVEPTLPDYGRGCGS